MTTFTSKSLGLNIVVKPSYYSHSQDGRRYFVPGKRAEFVNGLFSTDDQEIIDFLKDHRDYGVLFVSDDQKISQEELKQKEDNSKKKERTLAKKTTAKSTNKKLPVEGGDVQTDDKDEENGEVTGQFVNENLIP